MNCLTSGCGLSTVLLFIMVAALGALMVWHSRTARKKKALLAVLAALTVLCELGLHLMRGNMQVLLVPLGWGCMFLLLGGLVILRTGTRLWDHGTGAAEIGS